MSARSASSAQSASSHQSSASAQIEITIPDSYSWFFIQNATDATDELLHEQLAWKDPRSRYSRSDRLGKLLEYALNPETDSETVLNDITG